MRKLTARLMAALAGAVFALATVTALTPSAAAQEQARAFDIPAQSLSGALVEYSRQSGTAVVVPAALVAGKAAPSVRGSLTPTAALERLLAGSGLAPRRRPEGGLTLVAARASSAPSSTRSQARPEAFTEEVIVTGIVTGASLRELTRSYAGKVALATQSADQYPRWNFRICPRVAGLAAAEAQALIDHIARRAYEVGVETQRSGCHPNVVIVFAPDADMLSRSIVESRRDLLGYYGEDDLVTAGRAALQDFVASPRPVRWWHVSRTVSADGQVLGPSNTSASVRTSDLNMGATVVPGQTQIEGAETVRSAGTRMRRDTRHDLSFALIVVDTQRAADAPSQALADYLAMAALVQLDPDADMTDFSSILNLFAARGPGEPTPVAMTVWDLAYLQALYGARRTAPSARQQRIDIARRMAEQVASE